MLYCDAVASSIAVMLKDASPSTSTTVLRGAATLAPIAAGLVAFIYSTVTTIALNTCLNRQLCLERGDVQSDQGTPISYSSLSHELNIVTRQVILPRYDPPFISASLDLTTGQ
jgi:hypothetical protein